MEDQPSVYPLRELIALMVHDLSNPLQSLSMLLELAQDDVQPNTEAHERLVEASRAAVAMRSLVRGLGDFNRSSRVGDQVAAARLVSSTLKVLDRRFSRQGIELVDRSRGLEETMVPAGFQLVFLTLILSALAAEQKPGKPLTLTVSAPTSTSIRVELSTVNGGGTRQPWPLSPAHVLHATDLADQLKLALESSSGQVHIDLA